MAVTKIKSSAFPMDFTGNETLIVKVGDDGQSMCNQCTPNVGGYKRDGHHN